MLGPIEMQMHTSTIVGFCSAMAILAFAVGTPSTAAQLYTGTKWKDVVLKNGPPSGASKLKAKSGRKPLLLPAVQAARDVGRRPQAQIRHRPFAIMDRTRLHGQMPGGSMRTGTTRIGR